MALQLDGDDEIKITGEGSRLIMLKIMGGEEHDIYDFENPKNAKVYDYKSKNNSFKNVTSKFLTDSYDINNYNPNKRKFTSTVLLPSIDYSGDRGFEIGLQTKITHEGLVKNPFTSQHEITANYMALSDGVELEYEESLLIFSTTGILVLTLIFRAEITFQTFSELEITQHMTRMKLIEILTGQN